MLFSMKRSLVVFVALGLLAGLVGCGGSSAEDEAKQWIIDYTVDLVDEAFDFLEIKTYSPTQFVNCWLDKAKEISPRRNEPDFWQQSKANALNPDYVSKLTPDEDKQVAEAAIKCLADNVTGAEYSRLDNGGFIDGLREG